MQFTDEQAAEVKAWVVDRLEDISDADSDVLADYVLALLRTDAPDEEIKKLSIDNLDDFLKENTVPFVTDIFEKFSLNTKPETLPAAAPTPIATQNDQALPPTDARMEYNLPYGASLADSNAPIAPVRSGNIMMSGAPSGPTPFGGRMHGQKRPYNDRDNIGNPTYGQGDRPMKQMRRGRGGGPSMQKGYSAFPPKASPSFVPQYPVSSGHFPQPHSTTAEHFPVASPGGLPSFPFDPNDPMAAMMAMQAMTGLPPLPGMPSFPLQQTPIGDGAPAEGRRNSNARFTPSNRLKAPCRDYDTKGFCVLGDSCPYEHGTDHLLATLKHEEYDPSNAMMGIQQSTNGTEQPPNQHSNGYGNDKGRSRGRGRDRGGFQSRDGGGRHTHRKADFSHAGKNDDQSITTVVVESIPEKNFEESQVRDYFSQFGNVVEITMQPYKRLALVKYDNYHSAQAARKSEKPIFDNRFVKTYWYIPPDSNTQQADTMNSRKSPEPAVDPEEFARQQAEAQKTYEEKVKKRQETESARQALEKQKEELQKRHQEEKARLNEKLAAKGGNDAMDKDVDGTLDAVKNEDSKASAQTQALRDQLAALEAEAKSLGIDPNTAGESYYPRGRGRGRGRGSYRGRGGYPYAPGHYGNETSPYRGGSNRGAYGRGRGVVGSSVVRLDNRPRSVAIKGVEFDESKGEALREYLLHLGPFTTITPSDPTDSTSAQVVAFADRFVAEKLFYGPSDITGLGKVEFAWVANAPVTSTPPAPVAGGMGEVKTERDSDTHMDTGDDVREGNLDGEEERNGNVDYDVAEDNNEWDRIT